MSHIFTPSAQRGGHRRQNGGDPVDMAMTISTGPSIWLSCQITHSVDMVDMTGSYRCRTEEMEVLAGK
jgi:hypothetical protein